MHESGVAPEPDDRVQITGSEGAHEVRDFLNRNWIPFDFTPERGPLVVDIADGPTLRAPSMLELAEALGCHVTPDHDDYDLVVVGAGPAGLAAAVYGAAEGLRTLVVEQLAPGGQAGTSSLIENHPGFPDGVSGGELADRTHRQARRLGAEVLLVHEVTDGGSRQDGRRYVTLEDGHEIDAGAVVCATGVDWRRLDVDGVDDLLGQGVYYGAATSEAPGVSDQDIIIVGGGNSAGQAALFFAHWGARVTIAVRGQALAATLSSYLLRRIEEHEAIEVLTGTEVVGVAGQEWLERVDLQDNPSGATRTVEVHALFICIGGVPRTQWALDSGIACDGPGYLVTGEDLLSDEHRNHWSLERPPDTLETSLPMVYAVGDVRHGSTKRIATAMADGAMVVKSAQDRLLAEQE